MKDERKVGGQMDSSDGETAGIALEAQVCREGNNRDSKCNSKDRNRNPKRDCYNATSFVLF